MTLALITPHSIGDPWLWWTLGVSEGAGKPTVALRAGAVALDAALPLRAEQVVDLTQREGVVRLLRAIQTELRRRGTDVTELALDDLLREASCRR
jgi:hypothetical protein